MKIKILIISMTMTMFGCTYNDNNSICGEVVEKNIDNGNHYLIINKDNEGLNVQIPVDDKKYHSTTKGDETCIK